MLKAGAAKKVTIYVGEDEQYHGHALYAAILDFLFYRGIAGANVLRGIAGFGSSHTLHTTRILRLAENLPVRIEFIETAEKVDEVLPTIEEMAAGGLIEVQDTTVLQPSREKMPKAAPAGPALKKEGKAKLMRIYVGENDKWREKPLHLALVEALRANNISGVTVYQGILGYGANRRTHEDKMLSLSHDRPMLLSVVDEEEKLQTILPLLEEMVRQGLVVFSDVDIIKYSPGTGAAAGEEGGR